MASDRWRPLATWPSAERVGDLRRMVSRAITRETYAPEDHAAACAIARAVRRGEAPGAVASSDRRVEAAASIADDMARCLPEWAEARIPDGAREMVMWLAWRWERHTRRGE